MSVPTHTKTRRSAQIRMAFKCQSGRSVHESLKHKTLNKQSLKFQSLSIFHRLYLSLSSGWNLHSTPPKTLDIPNIRFQPETNVPRRLLFHFSSRNWLRQYRFKSRGLSLAGNTK